MSIVRKLFEDKDGNVVISEKPNLPIVVWAGAKLLSFAPFPVMVTELFEAVAFGAIFTWAWLEIFSGSCLFRRVLGSVVMLFILSTYLS